MSNKVNEKREQKISIAVSQGNWDEVSKLIDQPYQNSTRKDRKYGTFSLFTNVEKDGKKTEYINYIMGYEDKTEKLLCKEENYDELHAALLSLNEFQRNIIQGYYFENKSFLQLSREMPISDKTIKRHHDIALKQLKELLCK